MHRYVLRRVLMLIPVLFGIIFLVFSILSFLPGEAARMILGVEATPAMIEMFNAEFGLNQPFIIRFGSYLNGIFTRFDFGISYRSRQPVITEIMNRFPHTLKIAVFSVITVVILGVPLGVLAAIRRSTIVDASITVYAMVLAAIPGFWLGMVLIYIFALTLKVAPVFGAETWKHFILPVATLSFPASSWFIRQTRVLMLDTVHQEYTKTARAKGAPEYVVIWKHAFKNAVLPLINSMGLMFSGLLGGTIIIETIFSINGVGLFMLTAVRNRDVPVVMCGTIIMATLFCVIVLLIDLLYACIDPRIRAKFSS